MSRVFILWSKFWHAVMIQIQFAVQFVNCMVVGKRELPTVVDKCECR
jgi:hypothetical protein